MSSKIMVKCDECGNEYNQKYKSRHIKSKIHIEELIVVNQTKKLIDDTPATELSETPTEPATTESVMELSETTSETTSESIAEPIAELAVAESVMELSETFAEPIVEPAATESVMELSETFVESAAESAAEFVVAESVMELSETPTESVAEPAIAESVMELSETTSESIAEPAIAESVIELSETFVEPAATEPVMESNKIENDETEIKAIKVISPMESTTPEQQQNKDFVYDSILTALESKMQLQVNISDDDIAGSEASSSSQNLDKIKCECGSSIRSDLMAAHLRSSYHKNKLSKKKVLCPCGKEVYEDAINKCKSTKAHENRLKKLVKNETSSLESPMSQISSTPSTPSTDTMVFYSDNDLKEKRKLEPIDLGDGRFQCCGKILKKSSLASHKKTKLHMLGA